MVQGYKRTSEFPVSSSKLFSEAQESWCVSEHQCTSEKKKTLKVSHLPSSVFIQRTRKVVFLAWARGRILHKYKAIKCHAAGT